MDWRYNTIWYEQLPKDELKSVDFSSKISCDLSINGSYFLTSKFKSKSNDFADLPIDDSAIFIDLGSSNVRSFNGISKFNQIKRLELHYCLKLENDEGLATIKDSLEWLHIDQSKKFSPGNDLFDLSRLKVLCLNSCAPLENLDFLRKFPELIDFRFVDTNILDGNLEPLLNHPTLCSAGFLDKRHYNLKSSDLKVIHKEKRDASITRAHKGEFETYRYNVLQPHKA